MAARSARGSQDYVLTARQIVQTQNRVSQVILEGSAEGGLVEECILVLGSFASEHGHFRDDMVAAHSMMQWDGTSRTWKPGGSFPAFQVDPTRIQASAGRMEGPYKSFEPVPSEDEAPF